MSHFRGQIRGPHWGAAMDNMLIDFWKKHECLFNSSLESYYDKELKNQLWTQFASSIGKPVSDVERRSRSLRTQYVRVLWHPERVNTFQQKMLREKLDFLRPYIVRRRGDSPLEDRFDDREEGNEELETGEESVDQEIGIAFGSQLDANTRRQDPYEALQSVASTSTPAALHCPNPPPQFTDVSLSCDHHSEAGSPDAFDQTPDILNKFAEVMLADMREIKDPMALMRLRKDITLLVFKAVEEDMQRRCVQGLPVPQMGGNAQLQSSSRPQKSCFQSNVLRQSVLKRSNQESEVGRRKQRWEEMMHMRRMSRSPSLQAIQQSQAVEGMSEGTSEAMIHASGIKSETETPTIKTEGETL